jgi:uncharacterized membrane protein YdbT with pleckstrin-like domain
MIYLPLWIDSFDHPKRGAPESVRHLLILGALTLCVAIVGLVAIYQFLSLLGSRYEIGATELTLERGFLWRHRRTFPLMEILRIDVSSGPISRLFGLSDLHIVRSDPRHPRHEGTVVWLLGLQDGEAVRNVLLERRHQLQEASLLGELSHVRSPQELQMERLASAVERLERRRSKGRASVSAR